MKVYNYINHCFLSVLSSGSWGMQFVYFMKIYYCI